jgi:phage gpG-like protein
MARPKFGRSQGRLTTVRVLGGTVQQSFGAPADIIRFFDDQESKLQDLTEPLDRYGRYLVEEHIPNQFDVQGTPKKWAALSPKYRAWKARRFPGRPLLVRTGRMKAGFRWKAFKRSLRIINRVRAGQRSSTPRWFFHQFGGGPLPARPMLQVTDKDLAVLTGFVFEHLEGELG